MRQKRVVWFFIMIALGAAAGLVYGWVINPVKYVDTSPASLRRDYQADYVLMVAEIYAGDGNLEQANRRLVMLSSQPPARVVADAQLTARELGYAAADKDLLDRLAQALKQSGGGQP
jgi:hypothetical protein